MVIKLLVINGINLMDNFADKPVNRLPDNLWSSYYAENIQTKCDEKWN